MDIYLCIPGLDLQIDDLIELNINNYDNKLLWNTPTLDYFLRKGSKNKHCLSLSEIISNYILVEDLKSQIIKNLNLPVDKNYILVSPVFQNVQLHSMQVLYGNNILKISSADAHVFCNDLNLFFAEDNIKFYVYHPDLWILSTSDKFFCSNKSIFDIYGIVNYDDTPLSKDNNNFLKLQTEISTFLFSHKINTIRAEKGLLKINGAWLYNDIKSNIKFDLKNTIICGDLFWLPENNNLKHINFNDFDFIINNLINNDTNKLIIYIDILHQAILNLDMASHINALENIEKDFFVILQKYLNNKKINNLYIISNGQNGGILRVKAKNKLFSFFKKIDRYQGKWF